MAGLPSSVLFACSQNSIRSPMAEGMLKHFHRTRIYVDSCGVRQGEVNPFAIAVMAEIGIDVSKHRAKTFDRLEDTSYDLVVTLSPEAHHQALELTRTMACDVEYWPTFDPTVMEGSREAVLAAFREVRDALRLRILARFPLVGAASV
jgi:protein-tyrosine-phosphatase